MGIDCIVLGQKPRCLGEVPHTARLHAGDGQSCVQGGVQNRPLVAAGGFHHDQGRTQLPQALDQLRDARGIVGEQDNVGLALDGQIELVLGDIDPRVELRGLGNRSHVDPFLRMRACQRQRLNRLFGLRDTRSA